MDTLPQLNIPLATDIKFDMGADGVRRILDPLRGKFVAITPEEWVRRNFTAWLINDLGYPAALMGNEISLKLNNTRRRCDTVLYFPDARTPRMIIEYKAPNIPVTQQVFDQITRYNMVLKAPYLAVSNGMHHYCIHVDYVARTTRFLTEFPLYPSL